MATPHILYVRILLFLIVLAGGVCFAISLLFPNQTILFDFQSPDALKNTISDPRLSEMEIMENGNVPDSQTVTANAGLLGMHDTATVTFTLEGNSPLPEKGNLSIRKGYRSLFLPLSHKPRRSQEAPNTTLVSHANIVFVLANNRRYPITDATLVDALGYTWDDVVPTDSETLEGYEKQKALTLSSPHPNGTIFEVGNGLFYTVRDGQLYETTLSADSLSHTPIKADKSSRDRIQACELKRQFSFFKKKYTCALDIQPLQNTLGNTYEFAFSFDTDVTLQNMTAIFSLERSEGTFRETGALIKKRILQRFYDGEL